MLIAQGVTDRGRVRTTNEDALLCEPALGLFVVADGMGGHQAGEVASALAVEAIKSFLARSQQSQDFTWPYGIDPALSFHANRLMTAIKLANRRVVKAGESREDYAGLGTTVVAALVVGGRLFYAGVGDSRIYLHANGRIEQMTQDDSWAATVLGRSGMDNDAIASNQFLEPIESAGWTRRYRLVVEVALQIGRQAIGRLVATRPILLQCFDDHPIEVAPQK